MDDEAALVLAAKALAAFQETLSSPRTAFDDFRDALAANDRAGLARYPQAAQRGLALFTGRGQCGACHTGANFSNGEFHDTGLVFFLNDPDRKPGTPRRVDPGRHGGIAQLKTANPSTCSAATTTIPVGWPASRCAMWCSSIATGANSRCHPYAACRPPRPTCTMAARQRCAM
jgi:cytochrome c peroxidase